ncbi:hypothetical protein SeMB42_g07359 [Synchytrium endobioticum]|uniref:Uncharacterized protein n=1 Tax=Synchytrium endobioticum TaxID=286115 RepID=A0A507C397_9FUNG|nr:hypothetical protein SeMB42_g07359 [Synchytrium endobioticum]
MRGTSNEAQTMEHDETSEMCQHLILDYYSLTNLHINLEECVGQIVEQNRVSSLALALRVSTETAINSFIKGIEPKSLKWVLRYAETKTQEADVNGLNRFAPDLLWVYHRTILSRMKLLVHIIQNVYKYHDLLHPEAPLSPDARVQLLLQADNVIYKMRTHLRKVNHYGKYLEYEKIRPSSCLIGGNHMGFAINPVGPPPDGWPVPGRAISEQITVAQIKKDEAVLWNCHKWPAIGSDLQTSRPLREMVELQRYDPPMPATKLLERPRSEACRARRRHDALRDELVVRRLSVDRTGQPDAWHDVLLAGRRSVDTTGQQDATRDAPLPDRRSVDSTGQQDETRDELLPGPRSLDSFIQLHEKRDSSAVGSIVNDHMGQGSPVHQSSTSRRSGGSRGCLSCVFQCLGC